jgi:hypothetical protein
MQTLHIPLYRLEGVTTKEGYQAWASIDIDMREQLMHALIQVDPGTQKCLLDDFFFVGDRVSLIRVRNPANLETAIKSHRFYYECIRKSFERLSHLIDYLREKPSSITSREGFIAESKLFAQTLYHAFDDVSNCWYLHILIAHLPHILSLYSSIYSFSCSSQERKNSQLNLTQHSCTRLADSSFQLLQKERRLIHFSYFNKSLLESFHKINYPQSRSPMPITSNSSLSLHHSMSLDENFRSHITPLRKRKKIIIE